MTVDSLRVLLLALIGEGKCPRDVLSLTLDSRLMWYEQEYGPRLGLECFTEDLTGASALRVKSPQTVKRNGCGIVILAAILVAFFIWGFLR